MNGPSERRYSVQPPYIEPPACTGAGGGVALPPPPPPAGNPASDHGNVVSVQQAYSNLTNQLEQCQRTNESLHSKLGQLSVHLSNVQHTSNQNAQQNICLKEENERLRSLLNLPNIDVSREVDQRLRNLEEFCHKLSERESDRSDRLSASSGGISLSNISLVSTSIPLVPSDPAPLGYKQDASSTSEYSSLCSLDRVDGMSVREKVLELETNALKQDAKIKILERNLKERNVVIKRLKAELDQYRHSPPSASHYPREFTQI